MLDGRGDDMIAFIAKSKECTFESQIVSFAASTCENNLVGLATEQGCDLASRILNGGFRRRRRPMCARWVTESVIEKWLHRCGNRRIDGSAGVVVEIDALSVHLNCLELHLIYGTPTEKEQPVR